MYSYMYVFAQAITYLEGERESELLHKSGWSNFQPHFLYTSDMNL